MRDIWMCRKSRASFHICLRCLCGLLSFALISELHLLSSSGLELLRSWCFRILRQLCSAKTEPGACEFSDGIVRIRSASVVVPQHTTASCFCFQPGTFRFVFLFCLAHFLHGIGATPLFTIGVSYIDENVGKALSSLFVGKFFATHPLV